MNTLIFRTIAPFLTALMLLFSVFILLRGHNEPGGGFIGGLIAASALAIYGIANGVPAVRRAIRFHPLAIAGTGLLMSSVAGLISIFAAVPFQSRVIAESVPVRTKVLPPGAKRGAAACVRRRWLSSRRSTS